MIRLKSWNNSESLGYKQFSYHRTGLINNSYIHLVNWKIYTEHKYMSGTEQGTEDTAVKKIFSNYCSCGG